MAAVRHLKVVGPANVKRTVVLPVRKPSAGEHLVRLSINPFDENWPVAALKRRSRRERYLKG
jgi:hypothetical protein